MKHFFGTQPSLFSRRGEVTSQLAAERFRQSAVTLRRKVLNLLEAAGERGLTGSEVVEILRLDPWVVRPRLTELKISGHIVKTKETRAGSSGTMQRVWTSV